MGRTKEEQRKIYLNHILTNLARLIDTYDSDYPEFADLQEIYENLERYED